jgi:butyrate kinase
LPSSSTARTKAVAEELGIDLYFVSPVAPDELPPLDRTVFAVLKAHAKRLFHDRNMANMGTRRTKHEAVDDLIRACEQLPQHVIQDAWDLYF